MGWYLTDVEGDKKCVKDFDEEAFGYVPKRPLG